MTDNEESVGPARPMRPWRWDDATFKAMQVAPRDEQIARLSALQHLALSQAQPPMQNDQSRLYRMQRQRQIDGFLSTFFGI